MTHALLLTTQSVARRLGVSSARVRQMDDILQPIFCEDGTRVYALDEHLVAIIAAYEKRRAQARRGR